MANKSNNPLVVILKVVVVVVTALAIWFVFRRWGGSDSGAEISATSSAEFSFSALTKSEVVRVKDGDTYVLMLNGEETTVRLIGVDTAESVAPDEYAKENTSEGVVISEIVKKKIRPGDALYVEYDVELIDKYGRTLAYLYFEDGVMVQEWLLQNGYAQVMTVQPNCRYAERFAALQHIVTSDKSD